MTEAVQPKLATEDAPPVWTDRTLLLSTPCRWRKRSTVVNPTWWIWDQDARLHLQTLASSVGESILSSLWAAIGVVDHTEWAILQLPNDFSTPLPGLAAGRGFTWLSGMDGALIPCSHTLVPTPKREIIRQWGLLDPQILTWLQPNSHGKIQRFQLPKSAMRPLRDWIDYRTLHPVQSLQQQVCADPFPPLSFSIAVEDDFENMDAHASKAKQNRKNITPFSWWTRIKQWWYSTKQPVEATPKVELIIQIPEVETVEPVLPSKRSAFKARLQLTGKDSITRARSEVKKLELQLLKQVENGSAGFDSTTWIQLATLYDAAENSNDAASCWIRAAWTESAISAESAQCWLEAEARSARLALDPTDFTAWLQVRHSPEKMRALAALVVWVSVQPTIPEWFPALRLQLQRMLETHEDWLPTRAVWLVHLAFSRISGGDSLGQARTRDRLLDRLTWKRQRIEGDLPAFLRFNSEGISERFRNARSWLIEHHESIHDWIAPPATRSLKPISQDVLLQQEIGLQREIRNSRSLVDLLFSWGLARLGGATEADELAARALQELATPSNKAANSSERVPPFQQLIAFCWKQRLEEAREGKPASQFPERVYQSWTRLLPMQRYVFCVLSYYSDIFDPGNECTEAWDPLVGRKIPTDWKKELASHLEQEIDHHESTFDQRRKLREWLLHASKAEDRVAYVQLIQRVIKTIDLYSVDAPEMVAEIADAIFQGFRRLQMRNESIKIATLLAEKLLRGKSFQDARRDYGRKWAIVLSGLTHIAGTWYKSGQDGPAHQVLEEVRKELYETAGGNVRDRGQLTLAYIGALGLAPLPMALGRFEELFQRLKQVEVSSSTDAYFNLILVRMVEKIILALVQDEFTPGPQLQLWLDEEEFNLRQRIHRDVVA